MIREIKFRGKRVDNDEWVYGYLAVYTDGSCYITTKIERNITRYAKGKPSYIISCIEYEVDPKTVGQYTGVTDKDKNKIFEGDLYRSDSGYIFEVVYLESEACFVGVPVKEPESWVFLEDVADMERVGNKWDNPELLEVLENEIQRRKD